MNQSVKVGDRFIRQDDSRINFPRGTIATVKFASKPSHIKLNFKDPRGREDIWTTTMDHLNDPEMYVRIKSEDEQFLNNLY